jgi:AcrR family transcriptional regulator
MPVKHRTPRRRATPRGERPAQKRRTRKAILEAAIALLARGTTPSVNEVAAAADVSRRTVYLYFPRFDQLLLDATVGALSEPVHRVLEELPADEDALARVERLARAVHRVTPETERLGRSLVRLTLDPDAKAPADGMPRRGYRRIEWIESALAPWRSRLTAARWRRLVCALAMVIGWEAIIVQRDVCGVSSAEGEALSVWAARALVSAAFAARSPLRPSQSRLVRDASART